MKAKWIIVGAGVLVVAGAMPWVVGYVTEQQWQQVTHELNQSQPFVQMQTTDYHRGFFSAELDGTVTVLNPEDGETYPIEYRASVTHGITGSFMEFEPVKGWAPEGADWFQERPRLTLETRLWGTAALELEAPAMAIDNPESGESLRTSGGVARIEVSDAGSRVEALAVWPQLSLTGRDMSVRINDFRIEQNMAHLSGDVWTGTMEASIASAALTAPEASPMTLENLLARSSTQANDSGQRLDSHLSLEAGQVRFEGEAYGPHKLAFALKDLDVASWSMLTTSMTEFQSTTLAPDAGSRKLFEQQMAAMEQVNTAVRNLAAAGFSVGFPELTLDTPEGAVTGNVMVSHPELTKSQKAEMLMVMQQLTGEMNVSVPMALVEDYPAVRMQLAPLVKQGLLVPEGDRFVLAAKLNDMVVDVNGQTIPLPPLL
ncbi:MAG: YdgA family protein [Marinobacter sp.]|nr:YdgA family protein [Marinobacter sp.]